MGIKDKLMAKTAGIREEVDAEIAKGGNNDKPAHPRTAIGHAGAFQVEISKSQERVKELEAQVADLEKTSIPVAAISPNPWQPRRLFNEAKLQQLAGSIATSELVQPIIVRSVTNGDTRDASGKSVTNGDTLYQIVAGERRWRAHKILGKEEIKAVVIEASDADMRILALVENFDREDLTDYEFALAARNSEADHDSKKNLAAALGINRTELYRYLAFFQLPGFMIDDLEINPTILGSHAAEDIAAVIKKHGQPAIDAMLRIWPRVKSGDIDQGKIASLIEASITRSQVAPVQRDIRKLFVGREQAGSITRDAGKLKIEIKAAALTPERESELRVFVEKMFAGGS